MFILSMVEQSYIIDDDQIVLMLAGLLIDKHESFHLADTFRNGKEGLDNIKQLVANNQSLPDLILLDLNMPIMDGWEFLEELQLIPQAQDISIYIFTSSIDPHDRIRTKEFPNVKGYVSKPLTKEKLDDIASQTCK